MTGDPPLLSIFPPPQPPLSSPPPPLPPPQTTAAGRPIRTNRHFLPRRFRQDPDVLPEPPIP